MPLPLRGNVVVTQLFGSRWGGPGEAYTAVHNGVSYRCIGHPGIDLDCPVGTPIRAMKGGTLRLFGPAWGLPDDGYGPLGLHAVITLPSGEQHWYAHLSQALAGSQDRIDGGANFALSGATGNVTGPHLHLAVRPAHPDYANGFDGFEDFLSHFDHTAYPLIDLSLV